MEIAYLGPEGTFTEQAAERLSGAVEGAGASLSPFASIEDVFEAVESGRADYGVVPIENSIEGAVNTTIDMLVFDSRLFISRQLTLPIEQSLMVGAGGPAGRVTRILSHPQALAQCRKFIKGTYPDATVQAVGSTAEAAQMAASCNMGGGEVVAAIGSRRSAEKYGLTVLREGIQDNKSNTTQFVLLTKEDTSPPAARCSTSVVFSTEDRPGELYKILDIFAIWDLNMTKILSRPTKSRHGEYVFFVEISGYTDASDVSDALTMVERKTSFFRNLGSYRSEHAYF